MSVKIEYCCDRCGTIQQKEGRLWGVMVVISNQLSQEYLYSSSGITVMKGQDWCRVCAEIFHLLPTETVKPEEVKKDPTLEELLREIVREEINNQ